MEAVFLTLLEVSAASAVVILAVTLLSSLINRRFTARWKYWLWMVLAVRLLIPFNPSFEAAPARVEVSIPAAPITLPAAAAVPAPPVQPTGPVVTIGISEPVSTAPTMTTVELLMLVWLAGAVVFLLWQAVSYLRFRGLVKRWGLPVREDSAAAVVLRQAEAEFGIGGKIPALVCKEVNSPMMIGFFRPLLILPQEDYAAQGLSYILRHELTHYQRRDIWYKALMLLANAVHWFNPAVWLMAREASRDLEISCDAAVMKNAGMEERREYSEIILACIHRELKVKTSLSTHFYGGKKALKERFANILSTKKRRAGVIAFAAVLLCGALVGGLVACSATASDSEKGIPLENWSYISSFSDPLPEESALQIVCKDETAARLARAISPLEWFLATAQPPSFDSENPLDADIAARIAFDNTPRLDFGGISFGPDGVVCEDYPDHPITKRLAQIWEEEGQIPTDVIYAGEAAATLKQLFGVTDWEHHTVGYYNYFPEEKVYITYGDLIRGIVYPLVLSWEETGNGYSCEVVAVNARSNSIDGVEVTEENVAELVQRVPHYVFTFDMTSGEPVVTGFAGGSPTLNLRPGRIFSFWDPPQVGRNAVREVKGTQAELDRWNAAIRDPAIVRLDFNNMHEESMLLPVEQELEILTALWNAQVRLYEGNPDPSTGGGCAVIAYDGEENALFEASYVGDYFSVWLPGDEVRYYFDGEGTSLDDLLRSNYGVPLPQSIILRETTPLDYELWGILIDDPEEVALVTSLLSTQYLTPSSPDEAFWTDGGTPIEFVLDYGDHTITGACDPNQRRSEYDPSGSRLSTGGIMYNYPHETGIQLLAFLDSKGIDMGSWWKDYIIRSVAFQVDLESVDGAFVGGFMDFTLQMPASWTVSDHNDIYDGEGLLTAEVIPWIWDTGGTAFDRLAEKYPDAELVDASIGDLTGKRFTLQTPVEGMTAVNNEIYYYLRWLDYLIGIKFYPKAGMGGILEQREAFESSVRIIPSLYPGPVPGPDIVSVPVPDHAGDPNWPPNGEEINPDFGPYDNPDTSPMYSEEENAAWQREFAFYGEVLNGFPQGLPKESYSYYTTYGEGTGNDMQLVLEIGVIDEAAVDNFLASWTGMKWDKLVKKPGTISQAEQEAFCEKVEQLDLGPNVYIYSRPEAGLYNTEMGKILVSISLDLYASQEEVERWQEMPQAIKDYAAENGIPENMLSYMAPRYTPPGSNPDT